MPRFAVRNALRRLPGLLFALGALAAWEIAPARAADASPTNQAADQAWQTILEQAAGPGSKLRSREEAVAAVRQHLDKQESALRKFIASYPADPHRYSARIRLATVLAAKSRLLEQAPLRNEAQKILADLESDAATPPVVKADAGFAEVSQLMEDYAGRNDERTRDTLARVVRQFDADYPGDRRYPNLLAELATLYDAQPAQKRTMLEEALSRASDEGARQRITDDLKRLALLGHPLNAQLQPWQGGASIDLAARKGRATVILFWASWSGPALRELARLEEIAAQFSAQPVDFYAVSLDEDRAALAEAVKASGLRWPVHCDGRGWEGQLVRSLGINALPTVWVLDRKGNLLTLNARDQEAEIIRRALN